MVNWEESHWQSLSFPIEVFAIVVGLPATNNHVTNSDRELVAGCFLLSFF
jgi:hypothetical protein